MKTDRLNDEMFGKKYSFALPLVIVGIIILVVTLLLTVKPVHAMGITDSGPADYVPTQETANPCIPYVHSMVNKGSGFWSHTIVLTHGSCEGGQVENHKSDVIPYSDFNLGYQDEDNYESVTVNDTISNDKPSETPKVKRDNGNHYGNDKPDCNEKDTKNRFNGDNSRQDFENDKQKSK